MVDAEILGLTYIFNMEIGYIKCQVVKYKTNQNLAQLKEPLEVTAVSVHSSDHFSIFGHSVYNFI